jgi:hypothetical protein
MLQFLVWWKGIPNPKDFFEPNTSYWYWITEISIM